MADTSLSTRFDVTGQVPSLSGPLGLAAWVFAPSNLSAQTSPVVLVCLPGASYTKAYYHLEVPDFPPDAYSFALFMVKQGFVVVALDHLGVGESTRPTDGTLLTMEVVAQANALVTEQVRRLLREGTLITGIASHKEPILVGIGHSMGGYLLVTQQANHHSFDAIALLGYTNKEPAVAEIAKRVAESLGMAFDDESTTYEILSRMYQYAEHGYMRGDRRITRTMFHAADVPVQVIEADDALATPVPTAILTRVSADPQYLPAKAARIEVPVFLGNGELDPASVNFHAEPATYPLARDITLYQLAGSAHCHNFATTRHLLWDRLARWIAEVNPPIPCEPT